jgi:DNA repair protein RecO
MHKIHITDGLVLNKRGVGEANIFVSLLTPELGLVRASARSARKEESKLRYGLEPMTRGRYSLVRGRNEWKITGVENVSKVVGGNRQKIGKVSQLLLRLVQGEDAVPELFTTTTEGFAALGRAQEEADAESIECVLVLRILAHLGYLPQTPELAPFVEQDFFSLELAAAARLNRTRLVRAINESLSATGL